ncbi:hypothetical protein F2Q69_00037744 [Brassica cretica]|uniref:Gfo/Idh/MocA-like oxidoreductase C-terminal domain-containing protein n=1 Tax=Brassica cretica TaxID=69181 RepID=A0A8S9SH17_BRACR|nr:hypothetical protein F2Q69_00037744 [Brassica cretica]
METQNLVHRSGCIRKVSATFGFCVAFIQTVTVSHKNHMAPNADHPTGMHKLFICRVVSILDISVHYVAGLRMLVGCEVTSVSATTSHVDRTLPAPDNITSNLMFLCSAVSLRTDAPVFFFYIWLCLQGLPPKACNIMEICRIKRSVQLERGVKDGRHGYMATVYGEGGTSRTIFYPFSGVTEELKAFFSDISETSKEQEPRRLSCVEGTRDVAVLGAMLESGARNGAVVPEAKF